MKRRSLVAVALAIALSAAPAVAQQLHGDRPGTDASANPPSLSGLTLLATIAANTARIGYLIEAQCTAGLTVAFDNGTNGATLVVLAGAAAPGGQGGALDMDGTPHSGRIRIYSSSAGCQMAAREW